MTTFLQLIFVSCFVIITVVCTANNIDALIDDYADWYERRSEEASNYEFPKDARMYEAVNKIPQYYGNYDFIVIGGGSTGCVVASRLSEIPKFKVLLLEAGSYRDEEYTSVPAWVGLDLNSKFNWGFETVSQQHSLFGTIDRKWRIPKGKGVGGTSLINGLAYSRGVKIDYDRWAKLVNDTDWNYENVLPYFKKSENFTIGNPYVPIDQEYHGYLGPLHMTQVAPPQEFAAGILRGSEQLGYDIIDYNGRQAVGASVLQYYMKDGVRFDPEMGYLSPIRHRKNLKVLDKSYVTKIEYFRNSKKVKGVIFTRENKTYFARSSKEVVLSAGAIASPQILMLSGIGPREHLESLGIPVVRDLPVGRTLLDHTMTYVVFSTNVTYAQKSLKESIRELLVDRKGPLTRLTLSDAVAMLRTPVYEYENYPDVEYMFTDTNNVKNKKFTEEMINALNPNVSSPFVLQLSLLNQKSVGTITLKSCDPFEYPLIDPNLLSDEKGNDIETLYQAVRLFLRLTETEALQHLNFSLAVKEIPGCNHTEPLSKEYWYCYLRFVTAVGLHEMGSCPSGTSRRTAVVDSKLRVFGIEGLRVADASVIPLPVSGHTNAACTMVGEKVADFIKFNYKSSVH